MDRLPSIGIVTPSYNQGKYIGRTINSVISQDYTPQEYRIVDGGSSDNTVDILRSLNGNIWWVSERDDGQADAVNKGWKNMNTDIIGWINSDDIYMPGALRKVAEAFKNNPHISVVYGLAHHIDENNEYINNYPTQDWEKDRLRSTCYICQPTVFLRREVFIKAGIIDKKLQYCMDYEYWIRLEKLGYKFKMIKDLIAGSRMYEENKTLSKRQDVHKEIVDMLKEKYGKVDTKWIKALSTTMVQDILGTKKRSYHIQAMSGLISIILEVKYNRAINKRFYLDGVKKLLGESANS